jgi:cytochrome c553
VRRNLVTRSSKRRRFLAVATALVMGCAALALTLPAVRLYWSIRSSNPVRRGVALARQLGCFSCHGELGAAGLPDPGWVDQRVPSWNGGVWMMYVEDDDDIRAFILDGTTRERAASRTAQEELERMAIRMPAYRGKIDGGELADLVAAFRVLSGMSVPAPGTPARRGYDLARSLECLACHGPGGSGGLPNPGSLSGFVPGWYGADFDDLVRGREEFDLWVREGSLPRLAEHPAASRFLARQRIRMPAYARLTDGDLDALWAYAAWLSRSSGGAADVTGSP